MVGVFASAWIEQLGRILSFEAGDGFEEMQHRYLVDF